MSFGSMILVPQQMKSIFDALLNESLDFCVSLSKKKKKKIRLLKKKQGYDQLQHPALKK